MTSPPNPDDGATPQTRRWVARRAAVRAVVEQEQERERDRRSRRLEQITQSYHNPAAFVVGLLVVLSLVAAASLLFDRLRCDPLLADIPLTRRAACR